MFEYTFHVGYSEVDQNLIMTPSAVLARLEDCTVFHSEASGMPMKPARDMKEAWMVVSWQVLFSAWPRLNDEITARTLTTRFHGFEGDRDYTIRDGDGRVLIKANSRWVYMDLAEQHPIRVPEAVACAYGMEEPLVMERAPRRLTLPRGLEAAVGDGVRMTVSSLDNNGHVNNLEYIRIALGYVNASIESIREMRVEYKAQAHLGDLLTPYVYTVDKNVYVSLVNEEQRPCAIVLFMIN